MILACGCDGSPHVGAGAGRSRPKEFFQVVVGVVARQLSGGGGQAPQGSDSGDDGVGPSVAV